MAISETPALPLGSWVLVTGINGLVGSHVADQLLAHGYRVRGTVRNVQRCAWVGDLFRRKYGDDAFQLVQVEDLLLPGAFDEAIKGVSGVVHVATILQGPDPNELFAAIQQLDRNLLASAAAEPSVKRFVYTSSAQAASTIALDDLVDKRVTSESWNEVAIRKAETGSPSDQKRYFDVYSASKTLSERAVWDWVEQHKPGFVTNTVLPSMCFGASVDPEHQGHASTSIWPAAIFKNDLESVRAGINSTIPIGAYCVDVKDVGLLHVAGLTNPAAQNERLFAYAQPFLWSDVIDVFRKLFPSREFPEDFSGQDHKANWLEVEPDRRSEELLREMGKPGWSSLKQMMMANVSDLV
ncbi:NAD(P)-binding protein [Aspergillus sclerotiicarbonarius CBS 121057]|uniref:NAD(P)-binding protein n=1 Tax=Aspergillus sclerotiicarbonarius (strain CBS 121057 / IBT 28362) TaxID=1448318 RepID=A0A319EHN0_ASPSB|nr:NAD(P)-binding protein [Aspergillus sclerotiicarbonarius CBS 121057]